MKLSNSERAQKLRAKRQRIKEAYSSPLGMGITDYWSDFVYEVNDMTEINKVVYFLAVSKNGDPAIFKVEDLGRFVRLSPKRLLEKKEKFEMQENWMNDSQIKIEEGGKLVI